MSKFLSYSFSRYNSEKLIRTLASQSVPKQQTNKQKLNNYYNKSQADYIT